MEPAQPKSDPTEWVDRHADALFRYAVLRVRDTELAEELVQECFLAALHARERFEGASSERTWLIGILKRKIVDHVRRKTKHATAEADDNLAPPPGTFNKQGLWQTAPQRWSADPAGLAENTEFWSVVRKCLEGLPATLHEAFLLHELDKVPGPEVCELLGVSPSALWARLHRARLALRRCLETHWFRRPKTAQ